MPPALHVRTRRTTEALFAEQCVQALGAGPLSPRSLPLPSEGSMNIIILFVQKRKQRLMEVKLLTQDHTARKSLGRISSSGLPDPNPTL